jgi:hypothetical protein
MSRSNSSPALSLLVGAMRRAISHAVSALSTYSMSATAAYTTR